MYSLQMTQGISLIQTSGGTAGYSKLTFVQGYSHSKCQYRIIAIVNLRYVCAYARNLCSNKQHTQIA